VSTAHHPAEAGIPTPDPREPVNRLLRDLGTTRDGLSEREAARRLQRYGPNELRTGHGAMWPRAFARQFTHPLALLLLVAAALAWVAGTIELAWAIAAVVVLNALFAFVRSGRPGARSKRWAPNLPPHARVRRDGAPRSVPVGEIVPGDVLVLAEGDRVPADVRLLTGGLEIDASALTGESEPVHRIADADDLAVRKLDSPVLVFSGTGCVGGAAEGVVHATGAHTEIGRIASLAGRRPVGDSPLEQQVRRVAYLIAAVAVAVGLAFLPLGVLAGLTWVEAAIFAVGLLVANVPEGLLPTITLALAAGVRAMARRGALVKRLSAVETLGSTTVICTDKTGTLTQGVMRVQEIRGPDGQRLAGPDPELAEAAMRCSTADPKARGGDPTELALLDMAADAGVRLDPAVRDAERIALFAFDPRRRSMATLDRVGSVQRVHAKGAPEANDAAPRLGNHGRAVRGADHGDLPARPRARGMDRRGTDRSRHAAALRLPAGDHGELRSHRGLPGGHRPRRAHPAQLPARIGLASNRLLLAGIAFELLVAAAVIYLQGTSSSASVIGRRGDASPM
jgi:magnesium-transporting ATPase (P-type)